MDTDVSHEVDRRLTALEEKVGIGQEEPDQPDVEEDEEVEEHDAEEEAD